MRALFAVVIGLVGIVCCAAQQAADIIIVSGDVRTMADKPSRAEAIAIVGSRIIAVGPNAEIRRFSSERTQLIDAKGGLVLPGFNDSHVHFMAIGNKFSTLDLRNLTSAEALYERLNFYSRFLPPGRWIIGSGGTDELWQKIRADQIDQASPKNPLFLFHADAKSALTNSVAINSAGGAKIEPGIVKDKEFQLIRRLIPQDHTRRWAEIAETASNYGVSYGITSVQDTDSDDHAELYRALAKDGRLKVRIYDCHGLGNWRKYKDLIKVSPREDDLVRTGCLKGTADGDEADVERLRDNVVAADANGFQVLLHAIGERQVRAAVDVFETAAKANGKSDRRFRIEHAERANSRDLDRMLDLGIVASVQPHLFGGDASETGSYRWVRSKTVRSALGSDAPMAAFDPGLSVRAFVSTGAKGGLTLNNAIFLHTTASAYAEFQDAFKGKLLPGMLADIAIFDKAPNAVTLWGKTRYTIVNGRVVYSGKTVHNYQ